jgi:MFS transporter, OFA family, oxalate/formate antiporter
MWAILLFNVFSGGGVQGQMAPILQDVFGVTPLVASGLVSGAQAANMVGRFVWAALSDKLTRRWTYTIFFVCQCIIFGGLAAVARAQILPLFLIMVYIAFSMYGGGFACMPAFTADIWGAANVVEVYGGILTAWGLSGSVGPVVITVIRNSRLYLLTTNPVGIYEITFYIMCAVCAAGILLPQRFLLKPRQPPEPPKTV